MQHGFEVGFYSYLSHRGVMLNPTFKHLNKDWNAEPNAPDARVAVTGSEVRLMFVLNSQAYEAEEKEKGCLTFKQCSMWRLGETDDEGWFRGRCRYSKSAPTWGEFYELLGRDDRGLEPVDWHTLTPLTPDLRHFLFYLRDDTFECFSTGWMFKRGDLTWLGSTSSS